MSLGYLTCYILSTSEILHFYEFQSRDKVDLDLVVIMLTLMKQNKNFRACYSFFFRWMCI